jgi:tetratricopeptide (TPR) repeat protein
MPGAFAYHLHSTSAHSLRTTRQYWCGPLLADGATATMGCIDEPYLDGTPNIAVFFARWMVEGFSFGEAAYACQRTLSWQTTVIGDPLYRPFGKVPRAQHEELLRRHSKLIEWSFLRIVNIGLALGSKPVEMAEYLDLQDATRSSAVLMEKLADLRQAIGQNNMSIQARLQALQLDPSPQQRVRLTLTLADQLLASGRDTQALSLYDDFLKKEPDYPDAAALYAKMEALALKLHQDSQAGEYTRHIKMLTDGK